MRKTLICALFFLGSLSLPQAAHSQTVQFLNINPDPAVTGLSGISAPAKANAFAFWNNTAATVFSESRMEAGVSYGQWQPNTSDNSSIAVGAFGRITDFLAVTASYRNFTHKSYTIMDENGIDKGKFTPEEYSAGAGLAFKILPILSVGANVNYVSSKIGVGEKADAVTFDICANAVLEDLSVGLTANNLGSKISYGEGVSYSLPSTVKLGAAYSLAINELHNVTPMAQVGSLTDDFSVFAEAGAEYSYKDFAFVRAGYHYGDEKKYIPSFFSLGLGVRFFGFGLNAAYQLGSSNVNNSFLIALSWGF